jgi:hypothetical protein
MTSTLLSVVWTSSSWRKLGQGWSLSQLSTFFFESRLFLSLALLVLVNLADASAQTGGMPSLASGARNHSSSGVASRAVVLTEAAKRHPDFGKVHLPDSTGKDQLDFVELTDERTEYSALFHNFNTNTSCIRQSGDVPLHYKDEAGLWRNVEEKFQATEVAGVYEMPRLKFPIGFDSRDGSSNIRFRATGELMGLGENISVSQRTFGGGVVFERQAQSVSVEVGEREVVLRDIFPEVDFSGTFGLEGVKTSYVIKDRSFVAGGGDIVTFEEEISLPKWLDIGFNQQNGQMTDLGWQGELVITNGSGEVKAKILPASVWDSADHDADYVRDEHSTIGAFTLFHW